MESQAKRVVCIGGGHANCQVLKLLKNILPSDVKLILINEARNSYYSGMLPGSAAKLYKPEDIQVQMPPLAAWCRAEFIQERVAKVAANENKVILENGTEVPYDILALNVGSRTRGIETLKGVHEYALTTRPINELLNKIQKKEQELIDNKIIPVVAVCGAGAAGTELAFAFKKRWSDLFGLEIDVTIIAREPNVLELECEALRKEIKRKLDEKKIKIVTNGQVKEVLVDGVILEDGRTIPCNVAIWATGAEPHKVTGDSDLEILNGYFRVNDFLQSTSHKNVFAAGDCITMETYAEKHFPPKAGVYAVREGPFVARNILNLIKGQPMEKYVPQSGFLALLMTGDGKAIGTKFGIAFTGKWVWRMKDFIDTSFMKLFDPLYLFRDFQIKGTAEPLDNNELFEDEKAEEISKTQVLRDKVAKMDPKTAAETLACGEEEEEFFERLFIIDRMGKDAEYAKEVVSFYKAKE